MVRSKPMFSSTLKLCVVVVALFAVVTSCCAARTKVVLAGFSMYNYPKFHQYLQEKFNKDNPDIELEIIAGSSMGELVTTHVASGQQLDIAMWNPDYVHAMAKQNMLVDLTPYVQRQSRFSNWNPAALQAFRSRGGLWALPVDLQLPGVFYNVDAYVEVGLPLPKGKWTYEDMKRNALRLRKTDADGNTIRWGWKLPTSRNWVPMIWAYGADFVDSWSEPTRFTVDTSEMYQALGFVRSLVESDAIPSGKNHTNILADVGFNRQMNVMVNTNTLAMKAITSNAKFEWDVAPAPYGPGGRTQYFNAMGWFILNTSPNKDAAWRVLDYFTSEAAMADMVEMLSVVPPDRRYISQWMAKVPKPANKQFMLEDLETAQYPFALDGELYKIIEKEFLEVVWGTKAISQALEAMKSLGKVRLEALLQP